MILEVLIAASVVAGVVYAVKHHITVAEAKAEAEAVIAKVKAELAKVEAAVKVDESKVSADVKALVAKLKSLL